MAIQCKHCKATIEGPTTVCPSCKKNPNLAPVGKGMNLLVGLVALAVVLAMGIVVFRGEMRGCGIARADADPCAKEEAATHAKPMPPMALQQLRSCRSRQKAGVAPWKRDGGTRDELVVVPCPPIFPPWKVCKKLQSEINAADAGTRR